MSTETRSALHDLIVSAIGRALTTGDHNEADRLSDVYAILVGIDS